MNKLLLIKLIGLFVLVSIINDVIAATAHVSKATIEQGHTIQLELTWDGEKLAHTEPDLISLKSDFYIYGIAKGSQISIVNGISSAKKQWSITLLPKASGLLAIPAITIGEQKTQPINILVNKANVQQSNPSLFIEANWFPKKPYVQSQVLYTVKIFYDVNLVNGQLTNPILKDTLINRLQEDKPSQAMRHGKLYNVIERRYALSPKTSGNLAIQPPMFIGEAAISPSPSLLNNTETVQVVAPNATLHVNPQPVNYTGQYWLPSRQLTLKEDWSSNPPTFEVGEAITRTITVRADGLSAEQLPNLPLTQPDSIKAYPDKPVLENIVTANSLTGIHQQKIAYIPTETGKMTLPEITLTWFDITHQKTQLAKLPARVISVVASKASSPSLTTKPEMQTIANIKEATANIAPNALLWIIATGIFAILWLITLLVWRITYKKKKTCATTQQAKQDASLAMLRKKLKQACQQHEYKSIVNLLLLFAQFQYQDKSIINLSQLISRLQDEQAKQIASKLNMLLYGANENAFSATWQSIKLVFDDIRFTAKLSKKLSKSQNNTLPELY